NNLPFDLHEVGLIYRGKLHPLPDLPKGVVVKVEMDPRPLDVWEWVGQQRMNFNPYGGAPSGPYEPWPVVKYLMFHEKEDRGNTVRNHAHRSLDLSWRLNEGLNESSIHEAILVGRAMQVKGLLEQPHADKDPRLATHLWLGELPGTPEEGKTVTRDGKAEN